MLGQLIQVVFERMRLAGEAGCLLRIEEEIRTAVETARSQWQEGGRPEQTELFPELGGPKQQELRFDLSGVTRDAFWDQAEGRILSGLRRYAEEADVGADMGRRMFADDAAAGFAFIDLCRQHFDVVVMNPPFGAASTRSKDYIAKTYPRSKNDLLGRLCRARHRLAAPRRSARRHHLAHRVLPHQLPQLASGRGPGRCQARS